MRKLCLLAILLGGCAAATSGTPDSGTDHPDSGVGHPDADPGAPDAQIGIPDAHPGAPDAHVYPDASPGTPDASPTACTLVPNSGCGAGQCCDLTSAGDGTVACRDTGSGTSSSTCTYMTDCAAGYICLGDGTNASCLKYCTSDGQCTAPGGLCVDTITDSAGTPLPGPITVCSTNCNPISAVGCPPGWACNIFTEPSPGTRYVTECYAAGSGTQGSSCTYANDCAAGYMCLSDGLCYQTCNTATGVCSGGLSCYGLSSPLTLGGITYGVCDT